MVVLSRGLFVCEAEDFESLEVLKLLYIVNNTTY